MTLLVRILLILFALLLASLAAGALVTLTLLFPDWSDLALGPFDQDTFGVVVTFGTIFLSGFALIPVLLLVIVSEGMGMRSMLFYAVAGAVGGFVTYWSFGGLDFGALAANTFTRREAEVMTAAGIVGGVIYWAVAGRAAGLWRGNQGAPPGS